MILKLVNNSKRLLLVSICLLRKPSSGLHLRCREIEGEGGSVCTLGGRGSNHESQACMSADYFCRSFAKDAAAADVSCLFTFFSQWQFSVCLCGGCVVVCNMWYVVSYHKVSQFFCT